MANKHAFIPKLMLLIENQLKNRLPEFDEPEEILFLEANHIISDYITHILEALEKPYAK